MKTPAHAPPAVLRAVLACCIGPALVALAAAQPSAPRATPSERRGVEDGAPMVTIPAGRFWMGSDENADEQPRRLVAVDAFALDTYEVTNARYQRFMDATRQPPPQHWQNRDFNGPTQPVVGVTWEDAAAYCAWAGKRLPSEAEWEKGARGTDGRRYPWGDRWDPRRANSAESELRRPRPVGSFPGGVSPYGAQDMAGNVLEWVADWYAEDAYWRGPSENPRGALSGRYRGLRGGGFGATAAQLRTSDRYGEPPHSRRNDVGFRCARSARRCEGNRSRCLQGFRSSGVDRVDRESNYGPTAA